MLSVKCACKKFRCKVRDKKLLLTTSPRNYALLELSRQVHVHCNRTLQIFYTPDGFEPNMCHAGLINYLSLMNGKTEGS